MKFAANEFIRYLDSVDTEFDLSNLEKMNTTVFETEEKLFEKEEVYAAVSQLVISLIYLGIITVNEI